MTTWADMLDYVMPHATQLETALAEHMLRLSAIEFCRESTVDRVWLAQFDTAIGTSECLLSIPTGKALSKILRVKLDDTYELEPLRDDELRDKDNGKPTRFLGQGERTLLLTPPPDRVFVVDCRVALEPAISSNELETWIAQRHGEAIGHGALGRLLAMPKKPWTNADAAIYYKGLAKSAALDALYESDTSKSGAPTRTRPVFGLR